MLAWVIITVIYIWNVYSLIKIIAIIVIVTYLLHFLLLTCFTVSAIIGVKTSAHVISGSNITRTTMLVWFTNHGNLFLKCRCYKYSLPLILNHLNVDDCDILDTVTCTHLSHSLHQCSRLGKCTRNHRLFHYTYRHVGMGCYHSNLYLKRLYEY